MSRELLLTSERPEFPQPPESADLNQHLFITCMGVLRCHAEFHEIRNLFADIQANDVVVGLGRIPVGFFVAIEAGTTKWRTSNQAPQVHDDIIRWDDEIALPHSLSSRVRFTVCASFEFAPMLGSGEALRTIEISVGELLDLSQRMQPISFLPTKGNVVSPCSSLLVEMERRSCKKDERLSTINLNNIASETEEPSSLAQLTDQGHEALCRYQKDQKEDDLGRSIERFEGAVNICPPDCQYFAVVLFNLATARIIECQTNTTSPDFSLPIALFRNALALRDVGHPDRVATLLNLAIALASRFLKQGDQRDVEEVSQLITEIQQLSPIDSHQCRAADVVHRMCPPNLVEPEGTFTPHPPNADAPPGPEAVMEPTERPSEPSRAFIIEEVISAPDDDFPTFPRMTATLCLSVSEDLERSIPALEEAIRCLPSDGLTRLTACIDLGNALLGRFQRFGNVTDLHQSISLLEKARELVKNGHPRRPMVLSSLGLSLLRRFERLGDVIDADQSISVMEEAVQLIPCGHLDRPGKLSSLSISCLKRFERFHHVADLDRSISLMEEVVRHTPDDHPNKLLRLDILSSSLHTRFHKLRNSHDLDKSISTGEEALRLTPADHPDRLRRLTILDICLDLRFHKLDHTADLARSIVLREETLRLEPEGHPHRPWRIAALAKGFRVHFQRSRNLTDLSKSISMGEEVLRLTPDGHPSRPLGELGSALNQRFDILHDPTDLHRSIPLLEEALRLTPNHLPGRSDLLLFLGNALMTRFWVNDNIADVDMAISVHEEAVKLIPNHHPRKSIALRALGGSYLRRFKRLRDIADLRSSISMMEQAGGITPQSQPAGWSWTLVLLGESLISSFDRFGDLEDIDKAITTLEDALDAAMPDQASKPAALKALCVAFRMRFGRLHNLVDIDKSISMGESAMKIVTVDHANWSETLATLGEAYVSHFWGFGNLAHLHKGMSLIEEAIRATRGNHPGRPSMAIARGFAFTVRFARLGDLDALHAAISNFSDAARSPFGPSFIRFRASKFWITCAFTSRHQSLLDAYDCAINLLPQLAWVGLPLKHRYKQLLDATGTVRDAASEAVSLGQMEKAVEWLEQGRSIVWGQLLQLRSPLDELRRAHPNLADRLGWLSDALEVYNAGDEQSFGPERHSRESYEQQVRRYRALAIEREGLLEQVRALPGFERFLLPMTFSQLRACANSGPVIYLNIGEVHGDALIVMADLEDPLHIPLPDINIRQAEHLKMSLQRLLANDGRVIIRDDRAARLAAPRGERPDFNHILAELWTKIVRPVLYGLALVTPGDLLRVFWCPIGTLSFLPIHAAGLYDAPGPGNKVSDFVISSYIPALGTAPLSRQHHVMPTNIHILAVPQPSSDGQIPLPGVRTEIDRVKATISPHVTLHESNGIVGDVLDEMKKWDWVHFACHGVQDLASPTDSGLCLADGRRLRLSDIVQLSHPSGGLAFLSACQTAMGDAELPEEAVHLAAGMLFAGYESVIGTMWSIRDSVAPDLAKDVHEQLFVDGLNVPDCREAARALHHAVERLRQRGEPFIAWVPFIHIGL